MTTRLEGIKRNVSLKEKTTFQIGGPAKFFLEAGSKEKIILATRWAKEKGLPFFILGGGSNVLFSDKGYNGLVIKMKGRLSGFSWQGDELIAAAGAKMQKLVRESAQKSLGGLEWAVGIPGTIGGAVRGNAAAFESAVADRVKAVEAFDTLREKFVFLKKEDCHFGLKQSFFKERKELIILTVVLKLEKSALKEIRTRLKANLAYRREHHPLNFPSAGCIFKNYQWKEKDEELIKKITGPVLWSLFRKKRILPASFLIEKAGLKGKRIGQAQVSTQQANFIVNLGGASRIEVLKLISLIKRKVKEKFGIILEEEIEIV